MLYSYIGPHGGNVLEASHRRPAFSARSRSSLVCHSQGPRCSTHPTCLSASLHLCPPPRPAVADFGRPVIPINVSTEAFLPGKPGRVDQVARAGCRPSTTPRADGRTPWSHYDHPDTHMATRPGSPRVSACISSDCHSARVRNRRALPRMI